MSAADTRVRSDRERRTRPRLRHCGSSKSHAADERTRTAVARTRHGGDSAFCEARRWPRGRRALMARCQLCAIVSQRRRSLDHMSAPVCTHDKTAARTHVTTALAECAHKRRRRNRCPSLYSRCSSRQLADQTRMGRIGKGPRHSAASVHLAIDCGFGVGRSSADPASLRYATAHCFATVYEAAAAHRDPDRAAERGNIWPVSACSGVTTLRY